MSNTLSRHYQDFLEEALKEGEMVSDLLCKLIDSEDIEHAIPKEDVITLAKLAIEYATLRTLLVEYLDLKSVQVGNVEVTGAKVGPVKLGIVAAILTAMAAKQAVATTQAS